MTSRQKQAQYEDASILSFSKHLLETSQTIEILSLWSPGQALSELCIPLFPSPTFEPLSIPLNSDAQLNHSY